MNDRIPAQARNATRDGLDMTVLIREALAQSPGTRIALVQSRFVQRARLLAALPGTSVVVEKASASRRAGSWNDL